MILWGLRGHGSLHKWQGPVWKIAFPQQQCQVAQVVKNLPANARDTRDTGPNTGLGRSPGEGHGSPLQHSYLENPRDRGAWQATIHRVRHDWSDLACTTAKQSYLHAKLLALSLWWTLSPLDLQTTLLSSLYRWGKRDLQTQIVGKPGFEFHVP